MIWELQRLAGAATILPRRGLMIEVIGPAGSGKTSLIEALCRQNERFVMSERPQRFRRVLAFIRGAALFPRLLVLPRGLSRKGIRAMIYLQAWHAMYGENTDRTIILFDHGPLFRIALLRAFFSERQNTTRVQQWLKRWTHRWLAKLNMVIVLDAPNLVLMKRVAERREYRVFMTLSERESAHLLSVYRHAFNQTLKPDPSAENSPVILNFDTGRLATDDIVQQVLSVLGSLGGREGK